MWENADDEDYHHIVQHSIKNLKVSQNQQEINSNREQFKLCRTRQLLWTAPCYDNGRLL